MELSTVKLAPGDACLVVRKDGEVLIAYPEGSTEDPALIVMGLALALNAEEWVQTLITRTRTKLAEGAKG